MNFQKAAPNEDEGEEQKAAPKDEDEEGEEIHSCWNYIGDCRGDYLDKKNAMYGYIYSDGISAVDYDIEKENAKPKQLLLDLA